jgi:hypothetical protein
LVDLDGDLDLDLVIGSEAGTLAYYRNQGTVDAPSWVVVAGFFAGIDVGSNCVPTVGDYDNDGDLDLVTGSLFSEVRYYENAAELIRDLTILAGITVHAAPPWPIDADGDLDLAVGNYAGTFNYFENTSPLTAAPDPREVPSSRIPLAASPNPFNPVTTIRYVLPAAAQVTLAIHDVAGRRIRTLQVGPQSVGPHSVV